MHESVVQLADKSGIIQVKPFAFTFCGDYGFFSADVVLNKDIKLQLDSDMTLTKTRTFHYNLLDITFTVTTSIQNISTNDNDE
jgi:hypothetical protein